MNIRSRTSLAAISAAALVVGACGGDDTADQAEAPDVTTVAPADEPAGQPADEPAGQPADEPAGGSTGAVAAPTGTIAADLPEEFLPGIGPIDVVGASLPALARDGADEAVGLTAPTLVGLDYDGTPVRVDAAADGPTMVVFLAHWCPHCNAEIPRLNELRDDGRFPEGLNIVAVSTASRPDQPNFPPGEWLADMDWTYPAIADGVDLEAEAYIAADAFGVSGFPFAVLIDGDGTVVSRWTGEREPDEIIAAIEADLGL